MLVTVHIFVETPRRPLATLWGWRVVTSLVWCLSSVISFHPKTALAVPAVDFYELAALFEVAVLRGNMVAAIEDSAVSVVIHEEIV